MTKHLRTIFLLLPLAAIPGEALAYVGPGAGLSAIGAALALVGAILLGIIGFLWYPIKRLMKRKKDGEEVSEAGKGEPTLAREQQESQQPEGKETGDR